MFSPLLAQNPRRGLLVNVVAINTLFLPRMLSYFEICLGEVETLSFSLLQGSPAAADMTEIAQQQKAKLADIATLITRVFPVGPVEGPPHASVVVAVTDAEDIPSLNLDEINNPSAALAQDLDAALTDQDSLLERCSHDERIQFQFCYRTTLRKIYTKAYIV
ncbi:hypothetical protein M501DRAFT_992890 [Patellaria atrata CBS 101060]|uniref:Uncharacterized protein n=1 Tax=Patellaria atrata CBS 101060 TaxID=1346257 RepID=A0A9P4VPM7_9PEZI|nr:hypothetical protein M501DRAFT_992890 [Patellaria atrata CBS 101060]